jgi:hypothetical protein
MPYPTFDRKNATDDMYDRGPEPSPKPSPEPNMETSSRMSFMDVQVGPRPIPLPPTSMFTSGIASTPVMSGTKDTRSASSTATSPPGVFGVTTGQLTPNTDHGASAQHLPSAPTFDFNLTGAKPTPMASVQQPTHPATSYSWAPNSSIFGAPLGQSTPQMPNASVNPEPSENHLLDNLDVETPTARADRQKLTPKVPRAKRTTPKPSLFGQTEFRVSGYEQPLPKLKAQKPPRLDLNHLMVHFRIAHLLFRPTEVSTLSTSYTIRQFVENAVEFVLPEQDSGSRKSITENICQWFLNLNVNAGSIAPHTWEDAIYDPNLEEGISSLCSIVANISTNDNMFLSPTQRTANEHALFSKATAELDQRKQIKKRSQLLHDFHAVAEETARFSWSKDSTQTRHRFFLDLLAGLQAIDIAKPNAAYMKNICEFYEVVPGGLDTVIGCSWHELVFYERAQKTRLLATILAETVYADQSIMGGVEFVERHLYANARNFVDTRAIKAAFRPMVTPESLSLPVPQAPINLPNSSAVLFGSTIPQAGLSSADAPLKSGFGGFSFSQKTFAPAKPKPTSNVEEIVVHPEPKNEEAHPSSTTPEPEPEPEPAPNMSLIKRPPQTNPTNPVALETHPNVFSKLAFILRCNLQNPQQALVTKLSTARVFGTLKPKKSKQKAKTSPPSLALVKYNLMKEDAPPFLRWPNGTGTSRHRQRLEQHITHMHTNPANDSHPPRVFHGDTGHPDAEQHLHLLAQQLSGLDIKITHLTHRNTAKDTFFTRVEQLKLSLEKLDVDSRHEMTRFREDVGKIEADVDRMMVKGAGAGAGAECGPAARAVRPSQTVVVESGRPRGPKLRIGLPKWVGWKTDAQTAYAWAGTYYEK